MPLPDFDFDTSKKYTLITRGDLDGVICAVLMQKLGLVKKIQFEHPKDMQDGKVSVNQDYVSTNLPYVDGIYACFDHHSSEIVRVAERHNNHIIDATAPSAARVIYNFFGGDANEKFRSLPANMMDTVDQADSAQFSRDEVLKAEDWALLNFILDARTGLGRFSDFSVNQYDYMINVINYCCDGLSIEDIMNKPESKERIHLYRDQEDKCMQQLERCGDVHNNLVVLDLRYEDTIWAGNRFLIYALYPQCNISMHVLWGKDRQNTVFAVGKSIFDRSNGLHVGKLMLEYGGGGHAGAGTCQVENLQSETSKEELVDKIVQNS